MAMNTYPIEKVLALAIDSIDRDGYVKAECFNSTKMAVKIALNDYAVPSDKAMEEAKDIIYWFQNDKELGYSNMIPAIKEIISRGMATAKDLGILCYFPVYYRKQMALRRYGNANPSRHQGEIGQRITINISEIIILDLWRNAYGSTTYIYEIYDDHENKYTWSTQKGDIADMEPTTITGTVKKFSRDRMGREVTEITRCKIVA